VIGKLLQVNLCRGCISAGYLVCTIHGKLGIRYAAETRDLAGRIRYPISQKGKCGRAMTSSGLKEYELKLGLSGIFIAKFIGNG